MSKRKDRSETEHLKGIIRKQKSIINELKKAVNRKNKQPIVFDEELEEEYDDEDKCPQCGKGTLELIDLKIRKMIVCDTCSHRIIKK